MAANQEVRQQGVRQLYKLRPATIDALIKGLPARLAAGENVKQLLADGGNLYLSISAKGAVSWAFRYNFGRAKVMGIGPFRDLTLARAREMAATYRALLLAGKDPMEEREKARGEVVVSTPDRMSGKPFADALEAFIAKMEPSHKDKSWASTIRNRYVQYAEPYFRDTPIGQLTYDHFKRVFEQDVIVNNKRSTYWLARSPSAAKLRDNILEVMSFVEADEDYDGVSTQSWLPRFKKHFPAAESIHRKQSHPSLPYERLPAFIAALRTQKKVIHARCLEFIILTAGPRESPCIHAEWSEIDVAAKTWTVPKEKLKSRKNKILYDFVVPLSDRALEIIEEMSWLRVKGDPYVFHSDKKGAPLARNTLLDLLTDMTLADARAGADPRWVDPKMGNRRVTVHGFRSSFATYRQDVLSGLGFDKELAEFAMCHSIGGEVPKAYMRGELLDRRVKLMQVWSDYLSGTVVTDRRPKKGSPRRVSA